MKELFVLEIYKKKEMIEKQINKKGIKNRLSDEPTQKNKVLLNVIIAEKFNGFGLKGNQKLSEGSILLQDFFLHILSFN